jgi:putative transposase
MAKPYSSDLRERVIEAIEAGHTQSEAAAMFKLCLRTVNDYVRRWRTTGSIEPDKFGGHKLYKLAEHADKVKALIKAEPDQTVAELQAKLEEANIKASASAIKRFLKALQITYKKNPFRHGTKTRGCSRSACSVARDAENA